MIFNQNIIVEGSSTNFSGVTATQLNVINGKSYHNDQGELVYGIRPQLTDHSNYIKSTSTQSDTNINCTIRFNRGTYDISGQKKYKTITFTPTDREIILKYRANIKYEFLDDNIQIKITDTSNNETKSVYTSNEPQTVDMSGYFGIDIPVKVEIINSENIKLLHEKKDN